MITIATMESNNPLLILAAMTVNAVCVLILELGMALWSLATTTKAGLIAAAVWGWRPMAMALGLVAGVALALAFWWVLVQLAGGAALIAATAYGLKWLWKI